MATWKVESDWVYLRDAIIGTEKQKIRIELQTISDHICVYQDVRDDDKAEVKTSFLFGCDVIAASEIADLLVLGLINYSGLKSKASSLVLKMRSQEKSDDEVK